MRKTGEIFFLILEMVGNTDGESLRRRRRNFRVFRSSKHGFQREIDVQTLKFSPAAPLRGEKKYRPLKNGEKKMVRKKSVAEKW